MNKFVCLAGMPRSGSTLLSSILHQNPRIHAEGNSAVCQLMWDLSQSCERNCQEQLKANYRYSTAYEMISNIPRMYYANTDRRVIIDKCRSWTLPANQQLLRNYISDKPKTIVLTRSVEEIIASFAALYRRNNRIFNENDLLQENSEPLMRSLCGVEWAQKNNSGEFLFITYSELVEGTTDVLRSVYEFIDEELFQHDLNNIINECPEDDTIYNLVGMHDIRPTISKRDVNDAFVFPSQEEPA